MLSLATVFMWFASVMAMFVNMVVGQPIVVGIVGVVGDGGQLLQDIQELDFEDDYDHEQQPLARISPGAGGATCTIL